jgi:hypothetical protein
MTCAILELVRKVVENVQRDSIVQNLKGPKLSRKESKKDARFFKRYLYLADFASQFLNDFFGCGWFNL